MGPHGPTGWPLRGGGGGARVWLDCCPVPPSQTDPPHSAEPQRLTPGPTRSARARGRTSNVGKAQNSMALALGRTPAMSVELEHLPPKAPKGTKCDVPRRAPAGRVGRRGGAGMAVGCPGEAPGPSVAPRAAPLALACCCCSAHAACSGGRFPRLRALASRARGRRGRVRAPARPAPPQGVEGAVAKSDPMHAGTRATSAKLRFFTVLGQGVFRFFRSKGW